MKSIRVKLSPEAEVVYKHLNAEAPSSKNERMILRAVNQKVELIKVNPHYGDPITKDKIPISYRQQYGVTTSFALSFQTSGECCIR